MTTANSDSSSAGATTHAKCSEETVNGAAGFRKFLDWIKQSGPPNIYRKIETKTLKTRCFTDEKRIASTLNAPSGQKLIQTIAEKTKSSLLEKSSELKSLKDYINENRISFQRKDNVIFQIPQQVNKTLKALQKILDIIARNTNPFENTHTGILIELRGLSGFLGEIKGSYETLTKKLNNFDPPQGKECPKWIIQLIELSVCFDKVSEWVDECEKDPYSNRTKLIDYLKPLSELTETDGLCNQYFQEIDEYVTESALNSPFDLFLRTVWDDSCEADQQLGILLEDLNLKLFLQVFSSKSDRSEWEYGETALSNSWVKEHQEIAYRRTGDKTDFKNKYAEILVRTAVALLMSFYRRNIIKKTENQNDLIKKIMRRKPPRIDIDNGKLNPKAIAGAVDGTTLEKNRIKHTLEMADWESVLEDPSDAEKSLDAVRELTDSKLDAFVRRSIAIEAEQIRLNENKNYEWAWAIALTSKLAFLYVPVLSTRFEPVEATKEEIRKKMEKRIKSISQYIHLGVGRSRSSTVETKIMQKTTEHFSNLNDDDEFRSKSYRGSTDAWLLGKNFQTWVTNRVAIGTKNSEEIKSGLELLFCKPLDLSKNGTRLVQLVSELVHRDSHFKNTLWVPMAQLDPEFDIAGSYYFASVPVNGVHP